MPQRAIGVLAAVEKRLLLQLDEFIGHSHGMERLYHFILPSGIGAYHVDLTIGLPRIG